MKHLFLGLALVTTVHARAQNAYTATYTVGDIQSDIGFTTLPGGSSCPAQLTVNVPAGETIDSAVVSYTYFSSLAGFGSPTMQRSQIRCITTGQAETQLAIAVNPGFTTASYLRTITIANGLSTGPVTFEMHAGNTGLIGGPCTNLHTINNNTWSVTVHTSGGTTGLATTDATGAKLWLDGSDRLRAEGLSAAPTNVRIHDAMGRLLMESEVLPMNGSLELSLPEGAPGVMLVVVDQGSARLERRLARL
jgi:hypothetical protein